MENNSSKKRFDHHAAICSGRINNAYDVGLEARMDTPAASLSRGDKRRLKLAMCLVQNPRLLLLDEPTAGMARHDTNKTIDLLQKIKSRGMTKVIIEHDMHVGIQLVPEDRAIIPGLTVEENLILAQIEEPRGWTLERVYEHFSRRAERRTRVGITLSGGEQQILTVARALMRDIKMLLLDQPYEGLAPTIVQEIESILVELKSQGYTSIIVEQNAVAALKLADRAVILDTGVVVYDGSAQEVLENEALRHEYLAI